jgi:AbiU2
MNVQAQITKYKGLADILAEALQALMESFELLRPIAENAELLKRFQSNESFRGLLTIRRDLVRYCVLGITKLVYDTDNKNPTLSVLIGALLDPNHDPIRSSLKEDFSVPLKFSEPPNEAWKVEFWANVEKQDAAKLREAFDQYLLELEGHRDWFVSHEAEFLCFRDKLIAHLDTTLVGEKYRLRTVNGPTWEVMGEAIQRLIAAAEILVDILHRRDGAFDEFLKLARENASTFWSVAFKAV